MTSIVIIPEGVSSGTGTTARTYWDRLADELGSFLPTSVTAVAAGGDPLRVVIAEELRDDEQAYALLPTWLYVRETTASGGVQRRVLADPGAGYQGNQALLTLSRPLDALLAVGQQVVATNPLPMLRHVGIKGLRECTNEALAMVWIGARLEILGNGTRAYDLAEVPWLESESQTRGIYDTRCSGSTGLPARSWAPYTLRTNGVQRTLETAVSYAVDEVFFLDVLVRGDVLVNDGSGWGYRAPNVPHGLWAEYQQAAAPVAWVTAFGMVKALQFLTRWLKASRSLPDHEKAAILGGPDGVLERRRTWAYTALRMLDEMPAPIQQPSPPFIGGVTTA